METSPRSLRIKIYVLYNNANLHTVDILRTPAHTSTTTH